MGRSKRFQQQFSGCFITAGTRISVHIALDLLAAGETFDDIHKAYPHLSRENIFSDIE